MNKADARNFLYKNKDKRVVLYECLCKNGKIDHHFDYTKPLEVYRVCHKCHKWFHANHAPITDSSCQDIEKSYLVRMNLKEEEDLWLEMRIKAIQMGIPMRSAIFKAIKEWIKDDGFTADQIMEMIESKPEKEGR